METVPSILTQIWRHGLWIAPLLFIFGAFALGSCILGLVRLERRSKFLTVPLRERQEIEFETEGPVTLCIRGPRFASKFSGIKFAMFAIPDGAPVPSRPLIFRPASSGFSTVTLGIRSFDIPRPGQYQLQMISTPEDPGQVKGCEILFTRPHLAQAVLRILGIIVSAAMLIGGLVFFLLRLLGPRAS